MNADFKKFTETIKTGLERGEIKVSKELTTKDLAVQYAIERFVEDTHNDTFTAEEIVIAVKKYCGEDIYLLFEQGATT